MLKMALFYPHVPWICHGLSMIFFICSHDFPRCHKKNMFFSVGTIPQLRPANIVCSISDDRGAEATYAGPGKTVLQKNDSEVGGL
jgi:hypothetical protein